jgi:hypothetical protein
MFPKGSSNEFDDGPALKLRPEAQRNERQV